MTGAPYKTHPAKVLVFLCISVNGIACQDSLAHGNQSECRLYLAPSTIAGAGLGVFAGVDFDVGETVMVGDIVVPIHDLPFHTGAAHREHRPPVFWLWGDYSWDDDIVHGAKFDYGGEEGARALEMASFGIGAMPNCKFGLVNVHSDYTLSDMANEDRTSPANGAFTPYHDRVAKATIPIQAGAEIFEDYGEEYFRNRPGLREVPHEEDIEVADNILAAFLKLRKELRGKEVNNPKSLTSMMRDLYDIVKSAWHSRVINALPDQPRNDSYTDDEKYEQFLDLVLNNRIMDLELKKATRDTKWLKEEGICMDGIRSGTSNIPHAGRGAFATRSFRAGDRVAPVPLIHMPERGVLTKYGPIIKNGKATTLRNESDPIGTQMFLNYCFGHNNSTMLLSPYGHITSLINHGSGKAANARMVWAENWMRSPHWLKLPVYELKYYKYAGLGFDLIALREIEPGEEVLIDYGPDWEAAWKKHVVDWYAQEELPTGTAFPYITAKKLNENIQNVLLEAVKDKVDYSSRMHGVTLYCYYYKASMSRYGRRSVVGVASDAYSEAVQECRPVRAHRSPETGEQLFKAEIVERIEGDKGVQVVVIDIVVDAPATYFHFQEDPYTTAHQMPWSFRHFMAVPDDLFPQAWMNLS